MENVLIIGAGAIGRGFLPWVFDQNRYALFFVDNNRQLIETMKMQGFYTSYMAKKEGHLVEKRVQVSGAYLFSDFDINRCPAPVACFVAVGPRQVADAVRPLRGYQGPIILMENDNKCVDLAKTALAQDNVFFAIPDVIASNTASKDHLAKDPLALHTEDGVLYVDERAQRIVGKINYSSPDELKNQWIAKTCLHNTPHCIAAYLGALLQLKYVHEVMAIPCARQVVNGAKDEMLRALKLDWQISHTFLDWYAEKEMKRFSNVVLFDPVSRVAREPFRKLHLEGRLVGAALICMRLGFPPVNIMLGIMAALLYNDRTDSDRHIILANEYLPPEVILTYFLGLRQGEPLHSILKDNFHDIIRRLEKIKTHHEK